MKIRIFFLARKLNMSHSLLTKTPLNFKNSNSNFFQVTLLPLQEVQVYTIQTHIQAKTMAQIILTRINTQATQALEEQETLFLTINHSIHGHLSTSRMLINSTSINYQHTTLSTYESFTSAFLSTYSSITLNILSSEKFCENFFLLLIDPQI